MAGRFAFAVFALGIIGTGLLAVPVLAGSAAYALGEARRWPEGLARKPKAAKAFYATIALATMVGALINFSPINPIKALFWSAVINGVVAVPVMAIMMILTANPKIMGEFVVGGALRAVGWIATGVMAAAVVGLFNPLYRLPVPAGGGGFFLFFSPHRGGRGNVSAPMGRGALSRFPPAGKSQPGRKFMPPPPFAVFFYIFLGAETALSGPPSAGPVRLVGGN